MHKAAGGKELFCEAVEKEMMCKTTRQMIDAQVNTGKESKKKIVSVIETRCCCELKSAETHDLSWKMTQASL